MRLGEIGWAICLAGLPWSFFLMRLVKPFAGLDIWHANTWWVQGWVLILAGVHAMNKQRMAPLPASCWQLVIWTSLSLLWAFTSQLAPKHPYPSAMLMGLGNLWVIMLALLLMASWTAQTLRLVLEACFWSGLLLVGYGWLQVANLDQFFHSIDSTLKKDLLVGTIGNPTHFACQLALWLPLALIRPGAQKLTTLPALGLIFLAQSSTALALSALILLGWLWRASKRWSLLAAGAIGLGGLSLAWAAPQWLNVYGRWATWKIWWGILAEKPIMGFGLGFCKQLTEQLTPASPLFGWKHLHNEYLQWWVETGIIGLALLAWAGWQLYQRRNQGWVCDERWACGAMLIGCALMSLLNFPWHLWQLGSLGLLGLAGWLILTEASPDGA